MSKNYFAIERNGKCLDSVILADRNGNPAFEEFLDMGYDEMKASKMLADFVVASMEAVDRICGTDDNHTVVTLVGNDGVFIWGIIMGYKDENIQYCLVDWKKYGQSFRYEP